MDTKILTTTDADLKIAADILKKGGNVIFPTETVYGLGGDAKSTSAVKNIFKAKGRPSDNPLIVHIGDMLQLSVIAKGISDKAKLVMENFWPGPLTIILKKRADIPYETTGGLNTVAVRMPSSAVARRLIELSGKPIAAPSANLSGKPSPTTAKHCIDDMSGRVDAIICGDDCEVGVESTVLDMSGTVPTVLRPGQVTVGQLEKVVGKVEVAASIKKGETPKSPGLKYKHYSPNADVIILSGDVDNVFKYVKKKSKTQKTGMLLFDELPKPEGTEYISLGSKKKPEDAAKRLFSALREMDDRGVEVIFAPEIPNTDSWSAVSNRLYRAAGETVVAVSDKLKILFVCTGNTCRSPMAEAIFNHIAKDKAEAESAGIYADGSSVSKNTATVLSEIGIDVTGKMSRQINRNMISSADLILTMSPAHKSVLSSLCGDKIYTINEFADVQGEVPDPFGGDVSVYRDCRDLIFDLVKKVAEKL